MNMLVRMLVLLAPIAALLTGCASHSKTADYANHPWREIHASRDDAFTALVQTALDEGYVLGVVNRQSGVVTGYKRELLHPENRAAAAAGAAAFDTLVIAGAILTGSGIHRRWP